MNSPLPWYLAMYLNLNVPIYIIIGIVVLAVAGAVWKPNKRWLFLAGGFYLFLLCQLVIFREYADKDFRLVPFWNYNDVFLNGNLEDLGEIIINIVIFIPVGLFLSLHRTNSGKRLRLISILLISALLSLSIELLQLLLHRGLCETDDILHNTLGALIGSLTSRPLLQRGSR